MVRHSPELHADDVFDSFKALSMADHDVSKAELEKLNQQVLKSSDSLFHSARVLQAAFAADGNDVVQSIAALSSFQKRAREVASAASSSAVAFKAHLLNKILSPSKEYEDIRMLPDFFRGDVERILNDVLGDDKDDETALQRVLEECYSQSARNSGSLHASRWFDAKEKTVRESQYESDEKYTEPWLDRYNRCKLQRMMAEQRITTTWVRFWRDHVHRYQDGPTLFWPLDEGDGCSELPEPPKYLFRAADDYSSGLSNDNFVASIASMYGEHGSTRVDNLSLDRVDAAEALYSHLNKSCFGGYPPDDWMSWSSSLLFIIQYAIWRAWKSNLPPDRVRICAVDTTEYPRGQFVRDKWLFAKYRKEFSDRVDMKSFIDLRASRYDNGEYLSQGRVNIKNRSCVFSLTDLVNSGLYDLYPEFGDENGKTKWTNRVQELRSRWKNFQRATRSDIHLASRIAENCFCEFDADEMTVMLLAFKNYRFSERASQSRMLGKRGTFCTRPK